ncbi:exopolysaccharide biosynthesis polyprenyl glycosylphosphotransferase [Flavobacterium sp. W22_SRS_FP1]|uniref:exopolysaccharide biosynthesis polyprenyl glycosylphosphotransferase n=1 Tax=Flavobacterium sp. W22_SRS_FP1 TaxID=3240276 RepID=UPI003F93EDBA
MFKNKIHFEVSERKMILRLFDVFFALVGLYFVGNGLGLNYLQAAVSNFYVVFVLAIYINIFGAIFEMYNLQVASNEFQILKSTLLTVSTTVLVYLLTPIFSPELPANRLQIFAFYVVIFAALIVWRLFYVRFLASNRFLQNAILICEEEQLEELVLGLENIDPHYKIIGYVSGDTTENQPLSREHFVQHVRRDSLISFVKENAVTEVVIATQNTQGITAGLYQQLLQLLESGKVIREYAQVYESKTQRIPVQHMARDFYSFFPFSRSNQNKLYLSVIRFFEIVFSFIGLVVCSLLLPLILLGNSIGNRGKLFYTQERVGKDGTVFNILKLRTMVKNAESNGAVFTTVNDSRITAFGKFLRKSRIDEIPQFINIIKGEMAVIGPRPERPQFVKEIREIMPFYETRHVIKPGLTGWAQVNYSYGETIEDSLIKLQYDLYYIKHRSFYLDFNITLKTITTVLFYRGQ